MRFRQLSYANERDPRLKRWLIHSIERLSGRDRVVGLYETWRNSIVSDPGNAFSRMLDLLQIRLFIRGQWPPRDLPQGPLVMVANHPFGIGDGIAILSLAEALGRPFRILIHNELLKVPEMEPYALPVCFEETKEALAINMNTRRDAIGLLQSGTTVVIFPAGGVATAPRGFGEAEDLPWKIFVAKLVQSAKANVMPIHFEGQNGRLFHLVSRVSMTLRLSLLIREFIRLSGNTLHICVGDVLRWADLEKMRDRQELITALHTAVFSLKPSESRKRFNLRRFPARSRPEQARPQSGAGHAS
ncbi:lysophospholipid acyltransferase family protein [Rhizobium oryzicola]|uniref:Lysophospholipid acyltransferase family protein n=1 Tax=Rhizobium oryzicola TaxID=1232668 RepID=A0ABT8SZU0_9HYPH|nr:lysophospholipid acyltransferase family protein [Rhizobium oryzicola]MDO1583714.1 lysophospholipid acyltransferase family protein [Rhizobium oryzicola]